MRLTGLPLILLATATFAAIGAVTVWRWSRAWIAARVAGVLLLEASLVVAVGLVVNRHEQFYPSWAALRGETGTVAVAAPVAAGRLDELTATSFRWRPAELARWHLAAAPLVVLPADYRARPGVEFPVVLSFGAAVPRTPSAVTVTVAPTARTELSGLPAALRKDLRVTATGWDLVGGGRLGDAFVAAGIGVRDRSPADLPPALAAPLRLPTR
ncbi:lysyl-tRNA synthetase class 2 [Actinoplanes tereljensis]|uniref:Uncharacterized protein n=1 Tax=Paractinoplanes tereljensis TaxID=571912 RepID=A0A919NTN4_9ACTN|nr:hypothetical protein [Actinoplanes tereljensis]GIF23744.1 hypothetical protein Ate02nite_64740 [Actinoplanes tereljensis]